ncbi:MAG: hypothetical protein V4676_01245, partial [Bacteroidota bacterium]
MGRLFFLLSYFLLGWYVAEAQKPDKKLQQQLEKLIAGFDGNIGIYIKDLNNGKIVSINADTMINEALAEAERQRNVNVTSD